MPIGLPYLMTGCPAAIGRSATLCPEAIVSIVVTLKPAIVELPAGLERLERRRHVVALADDQRRFH